MFNSESPASRVGDSDIDTLIEDGSNMCKTSGPAGMSDGVMTSSRNIQNLVDRCAVGSEKSHETLSEVCHLALALLCRSAHMRVDTAGWWDCSCPMHGRDRTRCARLCIVRLSGWRWQQYSGRRLRARPQGQGALRDSTQRLALAKWEVKWSSASNRCTVVRCTMGPEAWTNGVCPRR